MRIAVMGSGGVGGYYGGMLSRAGEDVIFVARGAHLDAMRTRGLMVKTSHVGAFNISAKATSVPSEIGIVDLVLFCVKTWSRHAPYLCHVRRVEAICQRCSGFCTRIKKRVR